MIQEPQARYGLVGMSPRRRNPNGAACVKERDRRGRLGQQVILYCAFKVSEDCWGQAKAFQTGPVVVSKNTQSIIDGGGFL